MNRTLYLLCLLATLMLCACRKDKADDGKPHGIDSLSEVKDSATADSVAMPPKAADGLFDDFVYNYMRNKRFQMERTDFPLPNVIDGKNFPIERDQWKFDRLYSRADTYTIIFDTERDIKAEKDTTLKNVTVEWVNLIGKRVKQYHFAKVDGQWRLIGLEQHALRKNINSDFYAFYARFATDKDFQMSHIKDPFKFKTHDFDNFRTIEGVLDVAQWPDYCPRLPSGTITNINYGQHYGDRRTRVLMICSASAGMGCSLTFARKGKSWVLTKLVN